MKYQMEAFYHDSMGSIDAIIVHSTPMETKEEQALWQLNSMRRHDGLKEWRTLPKGVKFTRIQED